MNKTTQTDPQTPESPMSTCSVDFFQFLVDETYLEKINKSEEKCEGKPTRGTTELSVTPDTMTGEKTDLLTQTFLS